MSQARIALFLPDCPSFFAQLSGTRQRVARTQTPCFRCPFLRARPRSQERVSFCFPLLLAGLSRWAFGSNCPTPPAPLFSAPIQRLLALSFFSRTPPTKNPWRALVIFALGSVFPALAGFWLS